MAIKRDCFAFKFDGYCSVLTEMNCRRKKCSFYKTREQFDSDAEKARIKNEKTFGGKQNAE